MVYLLDSIVTLSLTLEPLAQAQPDRFARIPLWLWIVGSLIVVLIGVLWTLREEHELDQHSRPSGTPEPVKSAESMPVTTRETDTVVEAAPALPAEPRPEPAPPGSEIEAEPIEAPPPKPDDLKKVSGIGPKISKVLNEHGIFTYEQLAATDVSYLNRLLDELDWEMADPATWPEQARQLAEEKRRRQNG